MKKIILGNEHRKLLYKPRQNNPMSVIVFVSGGGGNLQAAVDISQRYPTLLSIDLIVTDRLGIKAIAIAKSYHIAVLAYDFEKECGIWAKCKNNPTKAKKYESCAVRFHNHILQDIQELERKRGKKFNFVVLSYHRWIQGDLLSYFNLRMINQHAGDLTVMNSTTHERKYRGINPVLMALSAGEKKTRTCTFIVTEGHDTGEILSIGPWVTYTGPFPVTTQSAWEHELKQKRESDWPSLSFALFEIAKGNFSLDVDKSHSDGCRIVYYKEKALPYGGVDLEKILQGGQYDA
ncbi:MAG: Methionyl-tRNA formyltransferase [Microgenomates group bacterium GW2011_GWC1_43_11]|nr:MAG: Methionyl-tRNA formyltransferase [Candidatus Gottesmanbacteria bacterium GW2011_GWA2_42_16]KKS90020.1 MAG: Methionyl-tRNA formyltransferase [Microgenomates group bacterium GW2011_GWC1_43_11]HCM82638.1 hypothetical protein [Patescibacteria group bacterium]